MSSDDTPRKVQEPTVRGTSRIDPETNAHVDEFEHPERGVWFVGYWSDGRAIVYDEGIHSVHLEPCYDGEGAWTAAYDETTESVEYECHEIPDDVAKAETRPVGESSIEHWIRNLPVRRLSALHPRYHWILEVSADE